MDTKSDENFLVIEDTIETNKQQADKNHNKTDEKPTLLTENHKETNAKITLLTENLQVLTALMTGKTNILKSSPDQRIHQLLQNLPPWFRLTIGLHHWKEESMTKFVACGPSNMRSAHQNSMSSSSIQISKETLFYISRISITKSRCV